MRRLCGSFQAKSTIGAPDAVVYANRTVRIGLCLVLVLSCTAGANSFPHIAFHDLPEGILGGVPGGTSVICGRSQAGWWATITRTITPRLDVTYTARSEDLFDLAARALLVKELWPLNVVVGLSSEAISMECTLLLGPVHIDYGRTWGANDVRWGYIQHAFDQTVTLLAGIEMHEGVVCALLGIRIHPGAQRLWGASLLIVGREIRLAVGGTL